MIFLVLSKNIPLLTQLRIFIQTKSNIIGFG